MVTEERVREGYIVGFYDVSNILCLCTWTFVLFLLFKQCFVDKYLLKLICILPYFVQKTKLDKSN